MKNTLRIVGVYVAIPLVISATSVAGFWVGMNMIDAYEKRRSFKKRPTN